jgi:Mg2+ and Co2+ transporter CorA
MLVADGASIGFALRCYVRSETPAAGDGSRLRPLWVRVVLTADYLLTFHEERVSLPAVLAPELPPERGRRYVVYSVLDAKLASSFDALEELELTLEALAATWTDKDGALVPRASCRRSAPAWRRCDAG